MIRRLAFACCLVSALFLVLPAPATAATATVKGSVVNVRTGPGTGYAIIDQVRQGERLEVLDVSGDWFQVRTPTGRQGYIAGWLVEVDYSSSQIMVIIEARYVNIRSGPGTGYAVVGRTDRGDAFPLAGAQGDWVKITLPAGGHGWVASWLTRRQQLSAALFAVPDLKLRGTVLSPAPVRRVPQSAAEPFQTLSRGATVSLLGSSGTWHQVALAGNTTGWVESRYLQVSNEGQHSASVRYSYHANGVDIRQYALAVVDRHNVNLRAGPSTAYAVVELMQFGTQLRVVGTQGEWLQVVTSGGEQGWVADWLTAWTFRPELTAVTLQCANPQQKTLTIEGNFVTPPVVFWLDGGRTAAIWTGAHSTEGRADLNQYDLGALSFNKNGVMLSFSERPEARVVERTHQRLVLAFGSAVTGVELVKEADREVLRFATLGYAVPQVTYDQASGLRIVFPRVPCPPLGSVLAGDMARSISAQNAAGGATYVVDTAARGRYIVRKYPNRVDIELPRPGLEGKVILLDPGHGGPDPGAIGPTGLHEKVPNLRLALMLKPLLEAAGARVYLTRETDAAVAVPAGMASNGWDPLIFAPQDLRARSAWALHTRADLVLSIHNNAHQDRSIAGTTTLYHPATLNSDASRHLAHSLHQALLTLGRRDRGVRTAELSLLQPLGQPAVVVEVVYVSNSEEEALLRDEQFLQRVALALLEGLRSYFAP
jgi:N-acetylmuramoyl-L-alanine amidase